MYDNPEIGAGSGIFASTKGKFILKGERSLKRSSLLTTIPSLGREYSISFEIYMNDWGRAIYSSIIHFTVNGNHGLYGDRIPAVWIMKTKEIHIAQNIDGNLNHWFNVKNFELNNWNKIQFIQELKDGKVPKFVKKQQPHPKKFTFSI